MTTYSGRLDRAAKLTDRLGERQALDRLVDAVRADESRVLVIRGEPGVGKTALLDYLTDRASDAACLVTRATGVQSEMELAFAGLHQVCVPMLSDMERLPGPQREALRTAFGLAEGPPPDRFLVGLPELKVEGLPDRDARALLEGALAGPLDARVRDLIVAETRGNPLALLELPRGLTSAELAGGFGLPGAQASAAPLTSRIEDSFTRRLDALPADTRRLVQLAAADPSGGPARAGCWAGHRRPVRGTASVAFRRGGRIGAEPVDGEALGVGQHRGSPDRGGLQSGRDAGGRWCR